MVSRVCPSPRPRLGNPAELGFNDARENARLTTRLGNPAELASSTDDIARARLGNPAELEPIRG